MRQVIERTQRIERVFTVDTMLSWEEMKKHIDYCNRDLKENIQKRYQTIKLQHTDKLNETVELIKHEEKRELGVLNNEYLRTDK